MNYRRLTEDEILRLKASHVWLMIESNRCRRVLNGILCIIPRFSGEVYLGVFHSEFMLPGESGSIQFCGM